MIFIMREINSLATQNKSGKNILKKKKREKGNNMKTYTLDEVQDKIIGKAGTPVRDKYEHELQMDLIGKVYNIVKTNIFHR